ncbi:MAG: hypothetical protein WAW80_00015 [Candidatus Saccharimonadales bacterium]
MSKKTNPKMSTSRVYVLAIAAVLVLGGVSSYAFVTSRPTGSPATQTATETITEKAVNAYASIPGGDILRTETDADILWNANDPYYGYNKDPIVALVHIDSIDGGRTYSPISEQYVFPQTIGKMSVREVYKGDVKSGEKLSYYRPGGTVTYDEYWNSLNKQQQDKILHLNNGKKPTDKKYIQDKFTDDIDVEAGKDYVVFLIPQSSKDGKNQEYLIDGFQYGLREAKGSGTEITVLNNNTKEWEALSSIVKLN